jgi:uncharacterized protein Usg
MNAQKEKLTEMEDLVQQGRNNLTYIIEKWTIASVQVVYYLPDHIHILNEFVWQTEDRRPKFPRIGKFLEYWDKNIEGPIKEVYIYDHEKHDIRQVDRRYKLN